MPPRSSARASRTSPTSSGRRRKRRPTVRRSRRPYQRPNTRETPDRHGRYNQVSSQRRKLGHGTLSFVMAPRDSNPASLADLALRRSPLRPLRPWMFATAKAKRQLSDAGGTLAIGSHGVRDASRANSCNCDDRSQRLPHNRRQRDSCAAVYGTRHGLRRIPSERHRLRSGASAREWPRRDLLARAASYQHRGANPKGC
jgi:hypothetical protein